MSSLIKRWAEDSEVDPIIITEENKKEEETEETLAE